MSEQTLIRRRALWAAALALLVAAGGTLALWRSLARASKTEAVSAVTLAPAEGAAAPARVAVMPISARAGDPWRAADEPSTVAAVDEIEHPHPITPAHQRLARERSFVANLDAAMDRRDGAGLRQTLSDYRREFPEDEQRLQTGYGVIADCLEHPGDEAHAAAERFYAEHRGSTLRRWVRRVCLDT